ncbi:MULTISPECIES: propanediol utilization microcompartment protein PduB [Acetomicrobium]|jgi:microcompartment protein PduB|uniref:propanediol utilization microcompartment protein PduB n=1 Tax=Acetomicrobium TaxID=49894 RepID=UPI0026EBD6A1|nr:MULTISPECIES: propanediol utilization microcompartment protein PduB [Acetomicrobium]MDI9377183.1 propanediol utilization microcompartment protein PduB [Synergistota bacterium]MDR9771048.1 propanediol utilization microcompartment protein PduB [Acetomicrobium sp.]HPU69413.1 propanediol utilization microcompartment protein PduB [Acetomicrobium flavidum]
MDQEIMQKVMDEVMKRIGGGSVISPEKASDQKEVPTASVQNLVGVTEYVGISEGDTIGLVVANVEPMLHEKLGIDKKFRSVGIFSGRTGAGPQIMAADEAVKATNTEIVVIELPRDTKGGAGHGSLIIFGAEDVSDARRAIEVALKDLRRTFGDVYANDAGHLEFQYTARASYACNKAFNAPIGRAFGLIVGAPAGIGFVMSDTALKAAEVELIDYMSPTKGLSLTNEVVITFTGDSGAVRQALIAARSIGKKLLGAMGAEPESATTPYI